MKRSVKNENTSNSCSNVCVIIYYYKRFRDVKFFFSGSNVTISNNTK